MNITEQDNGCCGGSFEKSNISLLGLVTLCFPLYFLSIIFFSIFWILQLSQTKFGQYSKVLINSNAKLIREKNIYSKFKCILSGNVFNYSPTIAGLIFKGFNFVVILLIWLSIILIIAGIKCL